jgi:hypothetical protein
MLDRKSLLSGLIGGLFVAILLAGSSAIATVGQAMIYGRLNSGDQRTTISGAQDNALVRIQNTGTSEDFALSLISDGPNLRVSNGKRIQMLNADQVDSFSADQLLRAEHTYSGDAPEGDGSKLVLTIDAPVDGILLIASNVDVSNTAASNGYACWLEVDDVAVPGSTGGSYLDPTYNKGENCGPEAARDVSEGTHTVELVAGSTVPTTAFNEGALWVLFVPFDGTGATVIAP